MANSQKPLSLSLLAPSFLAVKTSFIFLPSRLHQHRSSLEAVSKESKSRPLCMALAFMVIQPNPSFTPGKMASSGTNRHHPAPTGRATLKPLLWPVPHSRFVADAAGSILVKPAGCLQKKQTIFIIIKSFLWEEYQKGSWADSVVQWVP